MTSKTISRSRRIPDLEILTVDETLNILKMSEKIRVNDDQDQREKKIERGTA